MFLPTGLCLCEGDECEQNPDIWEHASALCLIWSHVAWGQWVLLSLGCPCGYQLCSTSLGRSSVVHHAGCNTLVLWGGKRFSLSPCLFVSTCHHLYPPWEAGCNPACISRHTPCWTTFPSQKIVCEHVASLYLPTGVLWGGRSSLEWKSVPCVIAVGIVRGLCVYVNFKILEKKSPVVHLGFKVNSSDSIRLTYDWAQLKKLTPSGGSRAFGTMSLTGPAPDGAEHSSLALGQLSQQRNKG